METIILDGPSHGVTSEEDTEVTKPVITIDDIKNRVARTFGVDVDLLSAKNRKQSIVNIRQIAMFFSKEFTPLSLKSIGSKFGGRDHSTVIHAIRRVERRIELRMINEADFKRTS